MAFIKLGMLTLIAYLMIIGTIAQFSYVTMTLQLLFIKHTLWNLYRRSDFLRFL